MVPRFQSRSGLGSAYLAGAILEGHHLVGGLRLSTATARRAYLLEWPAGKVLPREAPAHGTVSKSRVQSPGAFGVPYPPLFDGDLCLPQGQLTYPPGSFPARSVLGLPLRPPPDAFTPLPAELHPNLTTRERVALQTKPQACQSCHAVINPLGFIFERYDAIGRYREKEKGRKIDPTGAYQTREGKFMHFAGVRDLAQFLRRAKRCKKRLWPSFSTTWSNSRFVPTAWTSLKSYEATLLSIIATCKSWPWRSSLRRHWSNLTRR